MIYISIYFPISQDPDSKNKQALLLKREKWILAIFFDGVAGSIPSIDKLIFLFKLFNKLSILNIFILF